MLLTGSEGRIGKVVASTLRAAGHEPVPFDLSLGNDTRDPDAVGSAVRGCDAVAHLGAIPSDFGPAQEEIMTANVTGTWQVLRQAADAGVKRFVFTSSAQATGLWYQNHAPDYLPVDDAHPEYPGTAYMLSKYLGEKMCEVFTRVRGLTTVCLRPVMVATEEHFARLRAEPPTPEDERREDWGFGSWVHVDDVATAVLAAVTHDVPPHSVLFLCARDTTSPRPTRELLAEHYQATPWRGPDLERVDPFISLVDASNAERVLGWTPARRLHA